MASKLNPYISFRDNAREAMEFYQSALGGTLTVSTFGEFGAPFPGFDDKVMHASLETTAGFTLMAADTPPGMDYAPGSSISISLSGNDGTELRGYWERLIEGGTVTMPLEPQMWGDTFGMLVDRFGINWMVNIAGPSA